MDNVNLTSLLVSSEGYSEERETSTIDHEIRMKISQILGTPSGGQGVSASTKQIIASSPLLSQLLPSLVILKADLISELETNLSRLLNLNPSRREAVAQHLNSLAGVATANPASFAGSFDAAGGLRRWIDGPRSPAQDSALRTYLEELALIVLGQALLLKAWSDRGIRTWTREDLGNLNWALYSALKPHLPLDRESWQITRPNLYSWYIPAQPLQEELWQLLQGHRLSDEGPTFLTTLLSATHPVTDASDKHAGGYDSRFFDALWHTTSQYNSLSESILPGGRRKRFAFCPTLRDGAVVRTGPVSLHWIGTENSVYQLLIAELAQLWWGPAPPPLWAVGNGLETHARDQLTLALGSAKPSLISRITEMEACDLAFVFEEKSIRSQGRDPESQKLRMQLENTPYFRKIRKPTTTLGTLQACVALTKLRPGGLLWWGRDESLSSAEGAEALAFLLERGALLCEWDFSTVQHSLPSSLPLFPKHLYLLMREPEMETRVMNRPLRLKVQGQVRSHVEIPTLLEDTLSLVRAADPAAIAMRGHWKVHPQRSPSTQKDWAERWPDPASDTTLSDLEQLRTNSLPLAHATSVCRARETGNNPNSSWTDSGSTCALWIQAESEEDTRRLRVSWRKPPEHPGAGFFVYVPDDSWLAPLGEYLRSETVRDWLDHHAERRGSRWHLNEQTLRWIPVPKELYQALGVNTESAHSPAETLLCRESESPSFATPLPGEWEKLASELAYKPQAVRQALERSGSGPAGLKIHAAVFVRAARALDGVRTGHSRLASLVDEKERIRWRGILEILPKSELIPVTLHPKITLRGNLPLHVPIGRIERVKAPSPGVLLSTELGLNLHLSCDDSELLELVFEQFEGLQHPTWSELTQFLRVPKRMELAHATAMDILKSHGEQSARARELNQLLCACRLY